MKELSPNPERVAQAHILVVEDHPQFAEALTRLLDARGFRHVEHAVTAEDALTRAQANPPLLALVDASLPGHDGFWLVRRLHEQWPDLPVLMLSGYAVEIYVQKAMQAGARGYVLKDDVSGLPGAIRAALDGRTYISKMLTSGKLPASTPPPASND